MAFQLIETQSAIEFTERGARVLAGAVAASIEERGRCVLGLSGGATPRPVYEQLSLSPSIDWSNVWIFLVDERYVPPSHPESNQHLLWETLLGTISLPEGHLILPDTSLQLDECVGQYEQSLAALLRGAAPDVVTLGLGEDGHTASLFPPLPQEALGERLVLATETDRFAIRQRISLSLTALEKAHARFLYITGSTKKDLLERMTDAPKDIRRFPMQALLDERMTVVAHDAS